MPHAIHHAVLIGVLGLARLLCLRPEGSRGAVGQAQPTFPLRGCKTRPRPRGRRARRRGTRPAPRRDLRAGPEPIAQTRPPRRTAMRAPSERRTTDRRRPEGKADVGAASDTPKEREVEARPRARARWSSTSCSSIPRAAISDTSGSRSRTSPTRRPTSAGCASRMAPPRSPSTAACSRRAASSCSDNRSIGRTTGTRPSISRAAPSSSSTTATIASRFCLGPCADGLMLDAVTWTAAWGDAYVGHAVVIERGGATCPAAEPYGTSGNFGSPGVANALRPRALPEPAGDRG